MSRLVDGFVNELKDRIDLYDLAQRYVQLKKSGSSWVGLSPFNQEKTPSFYVHPSKGFFNCFSSGEKGDAISLVQKMENLSFMEAVEFLAKEFNFPLRYEKGSSAKPFTTSIKADLFALQEMVKSWFSEQFCGESEEAKIARNYWLNERRFNMDTANRFGIGLAPSDGGKLYDFLRSQNISDEVLKKSGLFGAKPHQGKLVCLFRGRLIIPIKEKLGRVCGFTGRKLSITPEWGDRKAPKYVNSPETPIFQKGELLFNLHLANKAISDSTDFLLVEGQLDAIRCWEEGFKTVIAPQGTAFKESQANLLKKSDPRRIVCLLDGDDAGKKAALSYVSIFMKSGLDARFATLPKGSDPDQVLEQSGPSALQKLIDEGKSSVQFVVDEKIEKVSEATPMIRKKVSEFFYEPLCELESFVVQDGFLEEIAKTMMITPDSVKQDFLSFQKNFRKRRSYRQQEKESNKRAERLTTVEDDLLYTILHNDRLASPLAQSIDLAWLDSSSTSGKILVKLLAETSADGPLSVEQIEGLLEDDEERTTFQHFLFHETIYHENELLLQLANECISVLFFRNSKLSEKQTLNEIKNASRTPGGLDELRAKLKEIRSKRNSPPSIEILQNESPLHA